jgi:hypothetical protein
MPLRTSQVTAMLFELVDGHCDLPTTVAKLEERLIQPEPALDWRADWTALAIWPPELADAESAGEPCQLAPPEKREARARADLRRLLALRTPSARRQAIDRSTRGMASPRLVEGLLTEALKVRAPAPRFALGLADAALRVATRLAAAEVSLESRFRLVLRVQAHRANLLRILGELPAAAQLWRLIAEQGRLHPPARRGEAAELLSLEASLRIDLRDFAAAEKLLARAEDLFRADADSVGAAKALLKRGAAAEYAGESGRALVLYQRAAELFDVTAEPFLFLVCQQNRASALIDLDRSSEAAALLAAHEELAAAHADPPLRERWRWAKARIARAEGRFADAASGFERVCTGLLNLQRPYDSALALLDAAELYLARGELREVKRLAARLGPILAVRGVHLEAQKALILFREAVKQEQLTATLLGRLRRYLLVGWNDPRFVFEPSRPIAQP